MQKLATFDDWTDIFRKWQSDIGFDTASLKDYRFEAIYETPGRAEIEFGEFAGRRKWDRVLEIPTQEMRDALMHLIVYQGDTEFASSEQQRGLVHSAPTEYDRACLLRVMREEMRHGWQMSHLLVSHFGDSGKLEARKLLERHAYNGDRLLGAFNQPVDHWLDFFTYTAFIDRDGKYQLTMLHRSAFAPLANSMGPMLKEEAFHLFTGQSGLARVLKAGKIPAAIIQKYLNKWISTAYDLFGKDRSSSVLRFYRWGFKGRFDEGPTPPPADLATLNEKARALYGREIRAIVEGFNELLPAESLKLYVPDARFNRRIGEYADRTFGVNGYPLSEEEYRRHLACVLPGDDDRKVLERIFREENWVAHGNA